MARQRSILIVDDNRDWRESMAELLGRWGFAVSQAMDASEVVRKTLEVKPDALILDLLMPGGSGHRVLEQLRARTETRRLPVLLVTGWPQEIRSAEGMGPVEVLTKPVPADALRAALTRLGLEPAADGDAGGQAG
jgi:two-component system LytT family response regulator